jgi:hypothetical protein
MARFSSTNPGRPFVKRSAAVNMIPANVNPGQWLTINGTHARLAANNRIVLPNGKNRKTATVSKTGFSLACGKSPVSVLSTLPVQGVSQVEAILTLLNRAM